MIADAGGWQHDTLTEDSDLSYRAQLKGWRFMYLPGLDCPSELPVEMHGFQVQQSRWAKGLTQVAKKLLPAILKADIPKRVKMCIRDSGYGAAEGGRDYNSTWIPENLLRDVYLAPFQASREAGIATYMSAFNDLNGVPASANAFTLRQILRDEWKFDGFVVSDYTAIAELIPHGYAADSGEAALKGIRGGVEMEMVSTDYWDHGKALIANQQLDPKLLDEAVRNILRIKFRLGLFDAKGQQTPAGAAPPTTAALETAKKLAAESLVLLQNRNGALPLAQSAGTIAVVGPLADSPRDQLGTLSLIHI